jgi:FKBP12-rapamycin complex-associated protein
MHVITSKQRPRRLHIHGSDGKDYGYLLKGHEDLRQDERVMQLFGLVNSLLANTPSTSARDLSIARYAVVPLSPNSGLIGWVPNCDTLHALIREHRDAHKVPLNLEQRLMLAMAPDYDHLPLVNKVRFFFFSENPPRRFFLFRRERGDARVEDLRGDATTHID